jgi:hypothetical protein
MPKNKKYILVNDYSGHEFQLDCSSELSQSYKVIHCYASFFQTPQPHFKYYQKENLSIVPIRINKKFNKYNFFTRLNREKLYGEAVISIIKKKKPQLVFCSNTPLIPLIKILKFCKKENIKTIFWMQDIYSLAIKKILNSFFIGLGTIISLYFIFLEKNCERIADKIIIISNNFKNFINKENYYKVVMVENWATPYLVKKNITNNFKNKFNPKRLFCLIYSGTIGLKHNPEIFFKIAERFPNIKIIISSEGKFAQYIKSRALEKYPNLEVINWLSSKDYYSFLSMADALLLILNDDASEFSVPSKIYSYLLSKKRIIALINKKNLAAKKVIQFKAGLICNSSNTKNIFLNIENIIFLKKDKLIKNLHSKNTYISNRNESISKIKQLVFSMLQ